MFVVVMHHERRNHGTALRETQHGIVGSPRGEESRKPLVCGVDGWGIDAGPECVVGRWEEDFDAEGWRGRVGCVDEVEGVTCGIEFGTECGFGGVC
jgi:hypothetical protein